MTNGNRWTFTVQLQYSSPLATAEWIVEAPTYMSDCSDPIDCMTYLPDFGSTTFTAISVNSNNPNLSRSQNAMMITDPHGKAWLVPSDPVSGNSFTMCFLRTSIAIVLLIGRSVSTSVQSSRVPSRPIFR